MLQRYDRDISIAYLPNFHRARVEFSSSSIAALVKYKLHKSDLHGKEIKAFFVKVCRRESAALLSRYNFIDLMNIGWFTLQ